jgi:hypothetical protein
MYESRPEKDTPENILTALSDYGGLSPTGKPIWQLVLAENCKTLCHGRMNYIAKGRTEAHQYDGEWNLENKTPEFTVAGNAVIEPDRIEEGSFWIPTYSNTSGWILRRWLPASSWGSRDQWEGERAQDGRTRLLAAYPQHGDYMAMPGCEWSVIPPLDLLFTCIRSYNIQQRANPVNWPNYIQAIGTVEQLRRQQAADTYAEELEAQYREGFSATFRSASSSAQIVRNIMAREVGGVNLGAADKWGS